MKLIYSVLFSFIVFGKSFYIFKKFFSSFGLILTLNQKITINYKKLTIFCVNMALERPTITDLFFRSSWFFYCFQFKIPASINASPLNPKDDNNGWTWVPTRSGIPIPINLANALSAPQLLFNVENDVAFELYTLKNKHEPQILLPNQISTITSSNFNRSLSTRSKFYFTFISLLLFL